MEVLLWLWFYDSNFFFNIKTTLQFYKNAWVLPIITHIIVCFVCMYYLYISDDNDCNEAFRLWQTLKFFISFLLMALLIYFIISINSYEKEEKNKFNNIKKVIYMGNTVKTKADIWIKRKTLLSPFGFLIFFFGVIYLFGSIFMMTIYKFDKHNICDQKLKNLLFWHSLFVILTNSPVIISLLIMLFTKFIPKIVRSVFPKCCTGPKLLCDSCQVKSPQEIKSYIKDYNS